MPKIISSLTSVMILAFSSASFADCYIQLNSCNPGRGLALNRSFPDTWDALAQSNPNRCLQRAREYLNFCHPTGVPGTAAAIAFFYDSKGVPKTATVVTPYGSELYSGDLSPYGWIKLQKNY